MGPIAVAKHLHTTATAFRHNNVPRAVERYAPGMIELPGSCSCAAEAAQVRPVAVPEHLNTMVFAIGYYQVALAIKRDAA